MNGMYDVSVGLIQDFMTTNGNRWTQKCFDYGLDVGMFEPDKHGMIVFPILCPRMGVKLTQKFYFLDLPSETLKVFMDHLRFSLLDILVDEYVQTENHRSALVYVFNYLYGITSKFPLEDVEFSLSPSMVMTVLWDHCTKSGKSEVQRKKFETILQHLSQFNDVEKEEFRVELYQKYSKYVETPNYISPSTFQSDWVLSATLHSLYVLGWNDKDTVFFENCMEVTERNLTPETLIALGDVADELPIVDKLNEVIMESIWSPISLKAWPDFIEDNRRLYKKLMITKGLPS